MKITKTNMTNEIAAVKILAATFACVMVAALLGACAPMATNADVVAGSDVSFVGGSQRKMFINWAPNDRAVGTCLNRHARLILYADGSREWEVELLSSDSGHAWQQDFHFYDADNNEATWFGSRWGGAFDINNRNVWTYWRYGRGPADRRLADAFDRIKYVVWSARC